MPVKVGLLESPVHFAAFPWGFLVPTGSHVTSGPDIPCSWTAGLKVALLFLESGSGQF